MSLEKRQNACRKAAAECFFAIGEFRSNGPDSEPERIRARVQRELDELSRSMEAADATPEQIDYARFALVATVDELILSCERPERIEWLEAPLQAELYGEHAGGERFFERLKTVEGWNDELLLELYLACLAYGFRGRYRIAGEHELEALQERLADRLAGAGGASDGNDAGDELLGAGERVRRLRGALPAGRILAVATVFSLLAWFGAAGLISFEQQRALDSVSEAEQQLRDLNLETMLEEES